MNCPNLHKHNYENHLEHHTTFHNNNESISSPHNMYCVCIVIKHTKNCSQVFLFIGEPQNLTKLGYHQRFGLKDLIYVKIRAYPALARLGPALARSKK